MSTDVNEVILKDFPKNLHGKQPQSKVTKHSEKTDVLKKKWKISTTYQCCVGQGG